MTLQRGRRGWTLWRLRLAVVIGALAGAACGPTATATPILTVAQARAAAQNYGRVDSKAYAQCSSSLNDSVETGDLAAIDDAKDFSAAACAARGTAPTPPPGTAPVTIPDSELVVPRSTTYPALFMQYADADLGHGAGMQPNIWVLTSERSGAPWRATAQVQLSAGPLLTFRRANGYAPAPLAASASGFRLSPSATCATVARYYNALYNGAASPPAVGDPSDVAKLATNDRDSDALLAAHPGFAVSRTWTCAGNDVSEATNRGDALVVFTLRGSYNFNPPPDGLFSLNNTSGDGKTVQVVPPGVYKHVGASEVLMLAALVPPSHSNAEPELIGSYTGIVSTTATPA